MQGMRSDVYLQPGERRGCVGCHEGPGAAARAAPARTMASARPPSEIRPGPDGTNPLSYPRLVQPILDRRCVRCHADGKLVLTGEPAGAFTRSYEALRPHVRWFEWGGRSIAGAVTPPGRLGADESPLSRILRDELHAREAPLSDEERRRLHLWLDANAPFYGTYEAEARAAQRRGEAVPPPRLQ